MGRVVRGGARNGEAGGGRLRARPCGGAEGGSAGESRGRGSCGCINLFNQKTQTHKHTKGSIKRRPGWGESEGGTWTGGGTAGWGRWAI